MIPEFGHFALIIGFGLAPQQYSSVGRLAG